MEGKNSKKEEEKQRDPQDDQDDDDEGSVIPSASEVETDDAFGKEDLQCRFYRNEWPEKDELVIVLINNVNEDGAYVQLLEYNNREALILASSVTRKRVKNVKKLLKLGTQDCMQVISIDKEGGFIDLSKRTVQVTDVEEKKQYFDKSKIVHLILRLTAHTLKVKLIDLYEKFGWDLYDKFGFDHAYDAFKLCLTDPDVIMKKLNITKQEREALLYNINKKMAAAPVKLRARFNLQCYTFDGIDSIRDSLLEAKAKTSDKEFELAFQLIAPPEYMVETVTLDKNGGITRLEKALTIVEESIKKREGLFKRLQGPTVIGSNRNEVGENQDLIDKMVEDPDESTDENNEEEINVDLDDDIQETAD